MLRRVLSLMLIAGALPAQATRQPAPAAAATPAPATVLLGIVYDSLRNMPLSGASVVLDGTSAMATTDEVGRFRMPLDSVADGLHRVGFFHPSLDSIGITPPTRAVLVRHGTASFVELAVPSMTTILRAVCPDSALTGGRGAVLGFVRDADTDRPLGGAYVVAMWTGMAIGNTTVAKVPRAVSTRVNGDGSYQLCGVPASEAVRMQARGASKASGWIDLQMDQASLLAFRNFLVGTRPTAVATVPPRADTTRAAPATAPSGAAPGAGSPTGAREPIPRPATTPAATASAPVALGSAVLTGTVVDGENKPLEGAQVILAGTQLVARTNYRGAFRLVGLPSGTQTVEVRLLSYSPRRYTVDLSARRATTLSAVLDERATVLEPVEVAAKPESDIPGFDVRRKRGLGSYITAEDIEKRGSILTTDLFRTIPGVQVTFDGNQYVVYMTRHTGTLCQTQWYIDGSPILGGVDDIDKVLDPHEIEAIEVYKSGIETPAEFQGPSSECGTIVVWTKRGGSGKKKPPTTSPR